MPDLIRVRSFMMSACLGSVKSLYRYPFLIPIVLAFLYVKFFGHAKTFPSMNVNLYRLSWRANIDTRFLLISSTNSTSFSWIVMPNSRLMVFRGKRETL